MNISLPENRVLAREPHKAFQSAAGEAVAVDEPASDAPAYAHQRARKQILLADDDLAVCESLARVLESEDYDVVVARNGSEAVVKFLSSPPDLVLLDLNMPGKDGWEVFKMMEKLNPLSPVIVITARPHEYQRAVLLGIDAFMEKPLDLPVLLQSIKKLLAEPRPDRIVRLTNGSFRTACLASRRE
jgi:two-component system response regulator VicR